MNTARHRPLHCSRFGLVARLIGPRLLAFLASTLAFLPSPVPAQAERPPGVPPPQRSHPFLIVTRDQFPALRQKAAQEPWKSMKADALARSAKGSRTSAYDLQDYIGAAALAYILDEAESQTHAHRVRDAILQQYSQVHPTEDRAWMGVVPPLGSFFVAILALDIVHDALAPADLARCEETISRQIFKLARQGNWNQVRLGTHGAWDVYQGTRTTPDDAYFKVIMRQITEDGVSPVTNHYAWERLGGGNSRVSKSGYMDVLEFTGIDRRYYSDDRIKKFMRWLFGSSVNCAKEMAIFGDMLPTQDIDNDMLHWRVVNFDAEAAGYAAWFLRDRTPIGHILTYILPRAPLPEPIVPQSRFFPNGGAFFREKPDDPNGLHGVLYNITSQFETHTHFETNGLALSGLGNRLLVNGGRLGATVQAAPLNNTLTINGENHAAKIGGGLTAGFLTDQLDFATGSAGPALAEGRHHRSLLLVHGDRRAGGYFVVLDEVETKPGNTLKNYLHPANQTEVITVAANQEFEAAIDHHPTVPGTKLSIYYATTPDQVKIESVQSAVPRVYPGYPNHNRLESSHAVGPDGKKTLVTLLYPHNAARTKAIFRQTQDAGLTISTVSQHAGAVVDRIFESNGRTQAQSGDVSLQAAMVLLRNSGSALDFLFVRHGTAVSTAAFGFEASSPVTLFVQAGEGVVLSPGGTLILKGPDLGAVRFKPAVPVLSTGPDFIRVSLERGTYRFARGASPTRRE